MGDLIVVDEVEPLNQDIETNRDTASIELTKRCQPNKEPAGSTPALVNVSLFNLKMWRQIYVNSFKIKIYKISCPMPVEGGASFLEFGRGYF